MKRHGNARINFFLIAISLLSGLILYRLFVLSVLRHSAYSRTSQAQNESISNILARGNIYLSDKNSEPLLVATNKKFPLVYIIPNLILSDKKIAAADFLTQNFAVERNDLVSKINANTNTLKVISRRISDQQVKAINELGTKGVGISYET